RLAETRSAADPRSGPAGVRSGGPDRPHADVERDEDDRQDEKPGPDWGREGIGANVVAPDVRQRLRAELTPRTGTRVTGQRLTVDAQPPVLLCGRADEAERAARG